MKMNEGNLYSTLFPVLAQNPCSLMTGQYIGTGALQKIFSVSFLINSAIIIINGWAPYNGYVQAFYVGIPPANCFGIRGSTTPDYWGYKITCSISNNQLILTDESKDYGINITGKLYTYALIYS